MRVPPSPPRRWLVLLPALCCLACSGPKLNPVQGKVLYRNRPLKGAVVTFHPKGANDVTAVRPVGLTGEDGTFTLTTGTKKGAPAGEYVVTILCSEEVRPKDKTISTEPPDTRDMLGGAYANRDRSKITVTVKDGDNQLDPFDLK